MLGKLALLALVAAIAEAAPQGFNYGATKADNTPYSQSEYEAMFKQAQNLPGVDGFNSARLYTMLQGQDIISAIPAAISTKTRLLLGMWVSGTTDNDQQAFENEMNGLKQAIDKYGDQIKDMVDGISVGNEDIYRQTPLGKSNPNAGSGQSGDNVADFIKKTKQYLAGTPLKDIPVGHTDTWTAWVDGGSKSAIDAADFLGVDAYPYWQDTEANGIENSKSLFQEAFDKTASAANGKPLWITETGWAVNGKTVGQASASTDNAQKYWQNVACPNLGKTPMWWYTLEEPTTAGNPDFSIFDASAGKPYFDLSCSNVQTDNSTSTSTGMVTSTVSGSLSTSTGSSSGSGANNGTYSGGSSPSQPSAGANGSGSSGSGSSGSGSGSGSSGSGSGSGSGSSGSGSGSASSTASSPVATGGATSFGMYSVGTLMAIAAGVVALL